MWAWLGISMLVSLFTLHVGTRIGAHDIRSWIAPEVQAKLCRIGTGWQTITVLATCGIMFGAQPFIPAILTDPSEAIAFVPLAKALVAASLCGVFAGVLAALSRIDLACQLLPDRLTALLIAAGLAFHVMVNAMDLIDAVIGAAAGYGALWLLAWLFKRMRNMEGMGRGDFAMTAGLGAWLGWQALPLMLAIASIAALAAIGISRLAVASPSSPRSASWADALKIEAAFGPALAFGGIVTWVQLG